MRRWCDSWLPAPQRHRTVGEESPACEESVMNRQGCAYRIGRAFSFFSKYFLVAQKSFSIAYQTIQYRGVGAPTGSSMTIPMYCMYPGYSDEMGVPKAFPAETMAGPITPHARMVPPAKLYEALSPLSIPTPAMTVSVRDSVKSTADQADW